MNDQTRVEKLINNPFVALGHKNFRYYWIGMCISLIGTWMQNIAQPWLAYTLTKSPLLLSLIGALQFTPVLLFSLFAGVIIDKFPKKNILLFTQTTSLLITLSLALLVWGGHIQYWHILIAATAIGMVNTLDMPARQSFVIELVGKDDLMNAIALNSSIFNLARIIGPALAGLVMGYLGIAFCFFANALSFGAVAISLLIIDPLPTKRKSALGGKILVDIKNGLEYIYQNPVIFDTLLIVAIIGTFIPNFSVLVPVFAKVILKQQEAGFGFLMSLMGLGSFIGAMAIATMSKSGPQKTLLYLLPLVTGVFMAVTGYMDSFFMASLTLAVTGFCFVAFSSTANSTMQLNTKDEYRGRVMSLYALVFAGSTPFGNLFAGWITNNYGPRAGFIACGFMVIALMLLFYMRQSTKGQNI